MNKKILILCSMLVLLLVINLGNLSAWEFDNIKTYDSIERKVIIENSFSLGNDVAELRLITPLHVKVPRGYQKVAEFDFVYYMDDNGGLDKINLYEVNEETKELTAEKDARRIDYKIKTYESVEVDDYETRCEVSKKLINGTEIKDCSKVKTGSHFEKREVWKNINEVEIEKGKRYVVGLFTDVKKGDYVEWIPTFYGVEISEWATWEENLNVDLISYYKMDETSGTTAEDSNGYVDGTANDARVFTSEAEGIINTSSDYSQGADYISFGDVFEFDVLYNFSVSLWFNTSTWNGALISKLNPNTPYDGWEINIAADGNIEFYAINDWTTNALRVEATPTTSVKDGEIRHLVVAYNGEAPHDATAVRIWLNGTELSVSGNAETLGDSFRNDLDCQLGRRGTSSNDVNFTGTIDEVAIYNRTLNQTDVDDLYNSHSPPYFNVTDIIDNPPVVTLNSPTSANYTTIQNITINCTAYDDINLTSVKLYQNSALNTTNASGVNNSDYLFPLGNVTDGDYRWFCRAEDNSSQTTDSSEVRIVIDTTPQINFTAPTQPNGTNLTSNYIEVNVSLTETYFENLTYYFYVGGVLNETITFTDDTRFYNKTSCLCDTWKVNATTCTTTGQCNSTETRTYFIDVVAPEITILHPESITYIDGYVTNTTKEINLNWSVNDSAGNLDTCWYYNGTANTTVTCNTNQTINITYGTYEFIFYANDTFGNENSASVTPTYEYNVLENSLIYETPVVEGENNQFRVNVSYNNTDFIASANLFYNGTSYAGTEVGSGSPLVFTRSLNAPEVSAETNFTFYWRIGLTNATDTYYFNSSDYNQSVSNINVSETGDAYSNPFINFTAYDEQTKDELNATFDITLFYKVKGGGITNNFSFTDTTENNSRWSFSFEPSDEEYVVDAILEMDATNYTHKFYNFKNLTLTNDTTQFDLFLLPDDDSTTFIVSVKDSSYLPLEAVEVYVQRYYPSINKWETIEITETNEEGETTQHFYSEDALYRFKIYRDGVLLYTTEETIIFCKETPCTVEIIIPEDFDDVLENFEDLGELTASLTYSDTTQDVTYTYTDTSGNFTSGRLYVILLNWGNSSIDPVCNTTSLNPTAVLTCDLTGQANGTYIASGYITRNDERLVDRLSLKKILSIVENVGLDGVLWSIFILVGIMMLGIYRPSLGIIFGCVGVILLSMLQLISIPITALVSIVGIAIILLIGVKRQ